MEVKNYSTRNNLKDIKDKDRLAKKIGAEFYVFVRNNFSFQKKKWKEVNKK